MSSNNPNIEPTFREGAEYAIRQAIDKAVNEAAKEGLLRTCVTCIQFVEMGGELCRLYAQRPPARVIAYGCKDYAHNDEIPF